MSGLTGPRTAPRGNKIAAVGMAIAIVATLLTPHVLSGSSTPWLIALGLVIGTAVGVPAARNVRMTAVPQMVALFNGVGGGAVAIIAWIEYRHHFASGGSFVAREVRDPDAVRRDRRLGLVLGVEHRVREAPGDPARPADQAPGAVDHQRGAVRDLRGQAIVLAAGTHSQALFIVGILLAAALLGNMVVLPIGGADMPVVISLLNAFTGLSAAATGIALNNTAMIVAGMIVGASGTILTNLMAKAMNRSVPAIVAGGFGGAIAAPAGAGAEDRGPVRSTTAQDVAIQLSYARQVVIAPGYGMAVAQAQHAVRELERALETKGVDGQVRDPPGGRPDARPHERAARRGRRPLRPAQGDGRDQPRVLAHRRDAGDRRQRRDQPGGQERAGIADLRHADPRGRPAPAR